MNKNLGGNEIAIVFGGDGCACACKSIFVNMKAKVHNKELSYYESSFSFFQSDCYQGIVLHNGPKVVDEQQCTEYCGQRSLSMHKCITPKGYNV